VLDDDVPASVTRLLGHVCGVIAAAMAALSGFGIWTLISAAIDHRFSGGGLLLVLLGIGITGLFFRWAGVLTGNWTTPGRLSVPTSVYAAFGVLCAMVSLGGVYLLIATPMQPSVHPIFTLMGVLCAAALAHWCYVLVRSPRK